MSQQRLNEVKARCEAEAGLCENCNIERLCCNCINAPWQLRALYDYIAEIGRLKKLVKSAHREGFAAIEGFAAYDADDELWGKSEARKALEVE